MGSLTRRDWLSGIALSSLAAQVALDTISPSEAAELSVELADMVENQLIGVEDFRGLVPEVPGDEPPVIIIPLFAGEP